MQCVVWCPLALLIVEDDEDEGGQMGGQSLLVFNHANTMAKMREGRREGGATTGSKQNRKNKQLGRDRGGMRGRSDEIEEGGERWMEIAGRSDKGSRRDWPQLQEQR